MKMFVPLEDGPFDAATLPMMVPYRCGLTCEHALRDRGGKQQVSPAPRSHPDRPGPVPVETISTNSVSIGA